MKRLTAQSARASARTIDRFVHAVLGRITSGVSPAGLILGYLDWLANLAMAPGRQAEPVYKLHFLADTDVTFLLANGGHNAGVVSEPGHPRRHYQVTTRREGERYVDAETWVAQVPVTEGSWWPEWQRWLVERSSPGRVAPPAMGAAEQGFAALGPAPGCYIFQE